MIDWQANRQSAGVCVGAEGEQGGTTLRPKSIKGVGDKDADAENYKKCHQSFKHGLSTQ